MSIRINDNPSIRRVSTHGGGQRPSRLCTGRFMPAVGAIVLILLGFAIAQPARAALPEVPRFANFRSAKLDCQASPFGDELFIGHDMEFADLATTADGYELHLLDGTTSGEDVDLAPLASTSGLPESDQTYDMQSIDLDGDGQDEVVIATADADKGIRLDVMGQDPQDEHGVVSLDHWVWSSSSNPQQVHLVKGNFDGSKDNRQELAVVALYAHQLRVFVLTGSTQGGIAQADGEFVGSWASDWHGTQLDVSMGDLLLDGRDQILIGNYYYSNNGPKVRYRLLEFDSPNPALYPEATDTRLGSATFDQPLAT